MNSLKCVITGASGYVGSHVATYLRQKSFIIYEMGRKPKVASNDFFIPYQLGKVNDYSKLSNMDVLIHCAYDFNTKSYEESYKVNILSTIELFREAKKQNVKKIIFISSMSAFPGVQSTYGKTKLKIEELSKAFNIISVRPGLIFSKNPQGIVGAMNKFVKISPIVPLIGLGKQIFYPCHVDDLGELLFRLSVNEFKLEEPIVAAANQPLMFKEIVKILAQANNKRVLLLPIPYNLLYLGLKTLETLNLRIGLRSDSLASIQNYEPNIDFNCLTHLAINFRNISTDIFSKT